MSHDNEFLGRMMQWEDAIWDEALEHKAGFEDAFVQRFWAKIGRPPKAECWEWIGAKGDHGY